MIDKNATSPITWEAILTLEREIFADASISLSLSYRRFHQFYLGIEMVP